LPMITAQLRLVWTSRDTDCGGSTIGLPVPDSNAAGRLDQEQAAPFGTSLASSLRGPGSFSPRPRYLRARPQGQWSCTSASLRRTPSRRPPWSIGVEAGDLLRSVALHHALEDLPMPAQIARHLDHVRNPEHVLHVVEPRLLAREPAGGPTAPRAKFSRWCAVGQFSRSPPPGSARCGRHHVAAAQRGEAMCRSCARPPRHAARDEGILGREAQGGRRRPRQGAAPSAGRVHASCGGAAPRPRPVGRASARAASATRRKARSRRRLMFGASKSGTRRDAARRPALLLLGESGGCDHQRYSPVRADGRVVQGRQRGGEVDHHVRALLQRGRDPEEISTPRLRCRSSRSPRARMRRSREVLLLAQRGQICEPILPARRATARITAARRTAQRRVHPGLPGLRDGHQGEAKLGRDPAHPPERVLHGDGLVSQKHALTQVCEPGLRPLRLAQVPGERRRRDPAISAGATLATTLITASARPWQRGSEHVVARDDGEVVRTTPAAMDLATRRRYRSPL